jgi:predicted Rossmann fold nucleotide-binding protein DprA/Smf involved in DNA uptake
MTGNFHYSSLGNLDILNLSKTAFLCSRKVPADVVLECYDWATKMRDEGRCIISGFHSPLEQDVLHFLLKGTQPVIMILARGIKMKWEPHIQKALDDNRLLIVSSFSDSVKRASEATAALRNDLMIHLSNDIVVGFASPEGMLQRRLNLEYNKCVVYLVR